MYFRTCGTFISDADIIASEKFFQEHKATSAAAATLNVIFPMTFNGRVVDTIIATQVYFHVVSKDTTASGGNVP